MAAVMITDQPALARSQRVETLSPRARNGGLVVVPEPTPRVRTMARVTPATFRRRRLGVLVGLVAAVIIAGQAGAALGGESLAAPGRAPSVTRYVVQSGDSLWTVAQELAPDRDPREVVNALVNARGNDPLELGEVLRWQH